MKKIVYILLAVIMTVGMLCGCENVPAIENPVPNTPVETVEPETTEATEPETQPSTPTVTEPATRFEIGEQVWIVYHGENDVGIKTGIVVAEEGQCVIVTTIDIGTSGALGALAEALENSSSDAMEYVEFYPVVDCYKDPSEAWAAFGREPME